MSSHRTSYSREDTKAAKGVAILFMLMHHLYAFPERIPGGSLRYLITVFGMPLPLLLGRFGKICVSIFFFLGGYGMYLSSQTKDFSLLGKVKQLYLTYWKYITFFIAIGFAFFANQEPFCEVEELSQTFSIFRWRDLIDNLLGISSSYNGTWWFLESYVIAILSFPAVKAFFNDKGPVQGIVRVVITSILITSALPAVPTLSGLTELAKNPLFTVLVCQTTPWVTCFWMGSVCAEYGLLSVLERQLFTSLKTPITRAASATAGVGVVIYLRQFWFDAEFDIFYVPVLLVCLRVQLEELTLARTMFIRLGTIGTGVWLVHAFFIYRFGLTAQLITGVRWAVPTLLLLLAASCASVILIDRLWSRILRALKRLWHG